MTTFGQIPGSVFLLKEPFYHTGICESFRVYGKIWWVLRYFEEDQTSVLISAEQKSSSRFQQIHLGRQALWLNFKELNRRTLNPNRQITPGSKWRHCIPCIHEETTITDEDMTYRTALVKKFSDEPSPNNIGFRGYRIYHSELLLNFDPYSGE